MAKRMSSVSDGLFCGFGDIFDTEQNTQDVQEVQEVHQAQEKEDYSVNKNVNERAEDLFSITDPYENKTILSSKEEEIINQASEQEKYPQEVQEVQEAQEILPDDEDFQKIKERQIQEDKSLKRSADTAALIAKLSQEQSVIKAKSQPKEKRLGNTQGKKGQKLQRINMAFSDSVHDYIRTECKYRGMSITEFVNMIIEEYMNSPDGYIFGKK